MSSIAQLDTFGLMHVTWRAHHLAVVFSRYERPANTCIDLITDTGERYATASTHISQELPPDLVAIKDYSENTGIRQALIDAGIIQPEPWGWVDSGYVRVYIHPLSANALTAISGACS